MSARTAGRTAPAPTLEQALRVADEWSVPKRQGGHTQAERAAAVEVLASAVRHGPAPCLELEPGLGARMGVTATEAATWWRDHARAPEMPTHEARTMLAILVDHAVLVPSQASVTRYGELRAAEELRALAAATTATFGENREVVETWYTAGVVASTARARAQALEQGENTTGAT